jgi:hypothetical protein
VKRGLLVLAVIFFLGAAESHANGSSVFRLGKEVIVEKDQVVRHVISVGGQVTVRGQVQGNILCLLDSVILDSTSIVEGDIVSLGGVVVQGRGAQIGGNIHEVNINELSEAIAIILNEEWEGWSWVFALVSIFFLLCLLVLGGIAHAIIPRQMLAIAAEIRNRPVRVTCWGVVGLISILPLAVLLTMSVVGIVLVPLQMTLAGIAAVLGFLAVAHLFGRELLFWIKVSGGGVMAQTALGLAIIWLLGWIPYVGWTLKVLVIVAGMGAVLTTRFGTFKS